MKRSLTFPEQFEMWKGFPYPERTILAVKWMGHQVNKIKEAINGK